MPYKQCPDGATVSTGSPRGCSQHMGTYDRRYGEAAADYGRSVQTFFGGILVGLLVLMAMLAAWELWRTRRSGR